MHRQLIFSLTKPVLANKQSILCCKKTTKKHNLKTFSLHFNNIRIESLKMRKTVKTQPPFLLNKKRLPAENCFGQT